jgi:hypothetical protein
MRNKKLLFFKSTIILVLALVIHTPECSAKGNAVGKAIGGSIKKAKKMLGDVKKMFKCIVPIGKAFASVAKNPNNGKKAMQSISKCMKSVKDLSKICDSPATLALTAVPEVGPSIGHGCGIASKYEMKYDSIMDKIGGAGSLASGSTDGLESAVDENVPAKKSKKKSKNTSDDDTSDGSGNKPPAGNSSAKKRKRN